MSLLIEIIFFSEAKKLFDFRVEIGKKNRSLKKKIQNLKNMLEKQ